MKVREEDQDLYNFVRKSLSSRLESWIEILVTENDSRDRDIIAKSSIAVIIDLLGEFDMLNGLEGVITIGFPKNRS